MTSYIASTPLNIAMVKKTDGRTLGGIDHQIEVLQAVPETRTDGDTLQIHKNDLTVAHSFIPENWVNLTADEKFAAKTHMVAKLKTSEWLQSVRQVLLSEKVQDLKQTNDIQGMVITADPFIACDFDVFDPKLGGFWDLTEKAKLATFARVIFKETMVALIDEEEASSEAVLTVVRFCLSRWQDFDPIDTSDDARDAMESYRNTCKFLELLLDDWLGASHKDI